jgi:hypothetical protein
MSKIVAARPPLDAPRVTGSDGQKLPNVAAHPRVKSAPAMPPTP